MTAVALVPLVLWFVAAVVAHAGAEHAAFVLWVGSPVVSVLLILLIAATFYHAALGLQVVVEDYVHGEFCKVAGLLLIRFRRHCPRRGRHLLGPAHRFQRLTPHELPCDFLLPPHFSVQGDRPQL